MTNSKHYGNYPCTRVMMVILVMIVVVVIMVTYSGGNSGSGKHGNIQWW